MADEEPTGAAGEQAGGQTEGQAATALADALAGLSAGEAAGGDGTQANPGNANASAGGVDTAMLARTSVGAAPAAAPGGDMEAAVRQLHSEYPQVSGPSAQSEHAPLLLFFSERSQTTLPVRSSREDKF